MPVTLHAHIGICQGGLSLSAQVMVALLLIRGVDNWKPETRNRKLETGNCYFTASSIAFMSSAETAISAALRFSSRCATDEVPGIGKVTGLRCRSQARDSCDTVDPCCFATLSRLPAATGNQGMKAR